MIVSSLPWWIVLAIAIFITTVYYIRYRKGWMGHWLAILFIFVLHFFFFAYGVIIFVLSEWIRSKYKKGSNNNV